jgi:hypothetical protein
MLSLNSVWFISSPCGKGRHRHSQDRTNLAGAHEARRYKRLPELAAFPREICRNDCR